nr:hypothetical protein [Photorhabdus khanii]
MKHTRIYADPPWTYRDKAVSGQRGAGFKYSTLSVTDICQHVTALRGKHSEKPPIIRDLFVKLVGDECECSIAILHSQAVKKEYVTGWNNAAS